METKDRSDGRRRWVWIGAIAAVAVVLVALAIWRSGTDDPRDQVHGRSSDATGSSAAASATTSSAPTNAATPTTPATVATPGAGSASPGAASPAGTSPGAAIEPSPTAGTVKETSLAGDGTFAVGGPYVPAGVYLSHGTSSCTWQRARNASGDPAAVIAKGRTEGDARVELGAGEVFTSRGCGKWVLQSTP
jgi:hypothetical protein